MLHGCQFGPSGSHSTFNTTFDWVLADVVKTAGTLSEQDNCYLTTTSPDDFLRRFWEVEIYNLHQPLLPSEEEIVVNHLKKHCKDETGRFIVLVLMKNDVSLLSESRSLAVKCSRL